MVTERKSGKLYAAKLVSKHIYQDKRDLLLRELHVMRKLDHEYVMKLHDAYESDAALILVCGLGERRASRWGPCPRRGRSGTRATLGGQSQPRDARARSPCTPSHHPGLPSCVIGSGGKEMQRARSLQPRHQLAHSPFSHLAPFSPPPLLIPSRPLPSIPHPQHAGATSLNAVPTASPPSLRTKPAA